MSLEAQRQAPIVQQLGDEIGVTDAGRYIEDLCGNLVGSMGGEWKEHFALHLGAVMLPIDRVIPLGLVVTERVVTAEAAARHVTADGAPTEVELLPDVAARLEIGSVAASALEHPLARALFADVTADVHVSDGDVADYHARNPLRFAAPSPAAGGWHDRAPAPALADVRQAITEHLLAAARRRSFRVWLDARRAALVELAPGYEHPGDPRQPDNTHKH